MNHGWTRIDTHGDKVQASDVRREVSGRDSLNGGIRRGLALLQSVFIRVHSWFFSLLLLAASTPAQQPAQQPADDVRVTQAIRMQQDVRKQYEVLIRIMHEVARRLEQTDPKTSAAISEAVQKAEAALIGEQMDQVIGFLQSGLVVPADAAQAQVIERLRQVLNALRGEGGLEWHLFLIEELKAHLESLNDLIIRQLVLERQSRMLAFGDRTRGEIAAARARVGSLASEQEKRLAVTRGLGQVTGAHEFAALARGMPALLQRLAAGRKELMDPAPLADARASNVVTIRGFLSETVTMRTTLRALLNREDIAKALPALPPERRGGEIVKALSGAADEFELAANEVEGDRVERSHVALEEAVVHMQDAARALAEMVTAFPGAEPAVALSREQQRADAAVAGLGPELKPLLPQEFSKLEHAARPADDPSPYVSDEAVVKAELPKAEAALAAAALALDPLGALGRQEQALAGLKRWSGMLDEAAREIESLKADPRYPQQKQEEQGIVDDLNGILSISSAQAETVEKESEIAQMLGQLNVALENAAAYASNAVARLEQRQPAEANAAQNDVIRCLRQVRDRIGPNLMMNANKYAMNEQCVARVQRMIMKQKQCRFETGAVWEKRAPDNPPESRYTRTQQLRIKAIARDQGSIEDDLDVVWEIINTSHNVSFGVFPPEARLLLELVRTDIQVAEKRLLATDAGEETQRRQDAVVARLETVVKILGQSGAGEEKPKERDIRYTYDSFVSRMTLATKTRESILTLLLDMQQDINRRTIENEKARRSGAPAEEIEQEAAQLRLMQEHVLGVLAGFAKSDAEAWKGMGGITVWNTSHTAK